MIYPSQLRVTDVRTFAGKHTLDLHPSLTVLVGANNAGKSTLLRAIYAVAIPDPAATLARSGQPDFALVFRITGTELNDAFPDIGRRVGSMGLNFPGFDFAQFRVEERPRAHPRLLWVEQGIAFSAQTIAGRIIKDEFTGQDISADQTQLRKLREQTEPFVASRVAFWSHGFEQQQHPKRMSGTSVPDVQRAMLYLRLNHPRVFERLEKAILREFPEFTRIAFVDDSPNDYVPRLQLGAHDTAPLDKERFGAGAWVFISVLTAAYVAHATGARLLLLDEPTLFMHAQLERQLLRELQSIGKDDGEQLQIVVATHSNVLVDAAARSGGLRFVDWENRAEARARVVQVPALEAADSELYKLVLNVSVGEVVYAETLLFVEGPSDSEALSILAQGAGIANPCRIVPLHQASWYYGRRQNNGERFGMLASLAKLRPCGYLARARLLLDEDSRNDVERQLNRLPRTESMGVHFVGGDRQDFEGLFCDQGFLVRFFGDAMQSETRHVNVVEAAVASALASQEKKGDQVLYGLFKELLDEAECKPAQLARVAQFLVDNKEECWARPVWDSMKDVLAYADASSSV